MLAAHASVIIVAQRCHCYSCPLVLSRNGSTRCAGGPPIGMYWLQGMCEWCPDVCFINWWYRIRTITTCNGNQWVGRILELLCWRMITTKKLLSLRASSAASSYHFCIGTTLVDHCQISGWYCAQNDNHRWISPTTHQIKSLNIFEYRWFPRYGVVSKLMWCIALVVNCSKAIEEKHETCSQFVNGGCSK